MRILTPRERILKSLAFEEPDRVPLDIGGINVTSIHVEVEKKLKKYFGFEGGKSRIRSYNQRCVIPDERILQYFGSDTRSIYFNESKEWVKQPNGLWVDEWGIGYKLSPDGYYYDFASHPLKDSTMKDLDQYQWPDPYSNRRLKGVLDEARKLSEDDRYCLVLEGSRECIFGLASWLRGHAQFYMDLVADKEFANALLDGLLEYQKKLMGYILDKLGRYVDVVKVADDLGAQNALIISPTTYREIIKPRQAELYRYIKERCSCKLLLHTDGAVHELIPDFIEMGVDILNPLQISADNMDPESLKEEFGGKIVFWGGGCDTQTTLPFGTPEEVREDVKKKIMSFKDGGGFVFAQIHNIQPSTPIENILAMYNAFHEFSPYN